MGAEGASAALQRGLAFDLLSDGLGRREIDVGECLDEALQIRGRG